MKENYSKLNVNEQFAIAIFATLTGSLTAWDLFGDAKTGSGIGHLVLEGLIVLLSFMFLSRTIHLLYRSNRQASRKLLQTQNESILLREDNQKYREESRRFLEGMSVLIDQQFTQWQLSVSERDVALLLLKGLSHKEIATIRATSEKTVRQQAGQVYEKSNLEGRAQLSAYFLEDLLLPREK
jgi:DNA-binding NarL/FixJ family response regulator